MKISLKYFFIIITLLISFSAENTYANPLNNPAAPDVQSPCFAFPGFINKIVQCVVHMTNYGLIQDALDTMHSAFVSTANSLVIVYVMLFGMRISLQQIKDMKKEATIVILTASCIIIFNNTTSITKFMNFFIKGQTEFVNATTSAITTKRIGTSQNANTAFLCDGYQGKKYTIWQRIDCVIGYVMGVHPLVKYAESHYDCSKRFKATDMALPVDPNDPNFNPNTVVGCYDYNLFATDLGPWQNPAEDPYKFDKTVGTAGNKLEVGVAFSMITIMTLMLFSDDFGLIVMITGVSIIIMLIMAFGQAVFVYISSLFMILFLGLFAPIIIPMFLFGPTRNIFTKWVQLFFSAMLTPGIMFAYLTFVLFALQYVLDYKIKINGKDMSIIEYHFGDKYKDADKDYQTIYQSTFGNKDINSMNSTELKSMIDATSQRLAQTRDQSKMISESAARNQGVDRTSSSERITEALVQNSAVYEALGGSMLRGSGENAKNLEVPNLDFSGLRLYILNKYSIPELAKTVLKLINQGKMTPEAGARLLKAAQNINDPEKWMALYQSSPELLEDLREAIQEKEREDYNDKMAYMQLLMIVFLTLSITFTFMRNVQTFAANLAKAGSHPAGRMIDMYNMSIRRMTAGMK